MKRQLAGQPKPKPPEATQSGPGLRIPRPEPPKAGPNTWLSSQARPANHYMSQYDATIHYLPGEENCTADMLSRLPNPALTVVASIFATACGKSICTHFDLEDAILDELKSGYANDPFTQKLTRASAGMTNVRMENGFWFINDRLVVPN